MNIFKILKVNWMLRKYNTVSYRLKQYLYHYFKYNRIDYKLMGIRDITVIRKLTKIIVEIKGGIMTRKYYKYLVWQGNEGRVYRSPMGLVREYAMHGCV